MKVAVVGAGSTYTPELVSGLLHERERIDLRELVLHDIDPDRREVVGGLATRILERQGFSGELQITEELDRALEGADAVLIQIRVGGQAARLRDETIPAACGCVGQETTGAGGLAKTMRTVPVVLEIAQRAHVGEVEVLAHDRGRFDHLALALGETVQARAEDRLDRRRDADLLHTSPQKPLLPAARERAVVDQHREHLLDHERVAARDREHRRGELGRGWAAFQELGDERSAVVVG